MEMKIVTTKIPDGANIIIGQTHFIKTVEDLYEIMVNAVPGIKFGIAARNQLLRKIGYKL